MTKEDFAKMINKREQDALLSADDCLTATENNLVVVFAYSDDLLELEGSMIDDAKRIKELLGRENISFYEFIIANLVRLAKVDKMVHEEIKFIQQVGEEFELNKNPVIKFCENLIKNFQKKNLELSNNA